MKGKVDSQNIIIGIMVLVILGSVAGTYFLTGMLLEAKQEVANTAQLIEGETNKNDRLDQISNNFRQVSAEGFGERFDEMLPGETDFINLIEELEEIADISGGRMVKSLGEAKLTEDAIEIDNPEIARAQGSSNVVLKGDGFAVVQIAATLRTRHDGLIEFLQYINDSKYFINVDSLFIRRVIVDDGPDVIDVGMVLNAYVNEVKGL